MMNVPCENINVKDIHVDDSRFSLTPYLFEQYTEESCQVQSFNTLGILYPIVVYKDNRNHYHLVDGRKRVQHAIKTGQDRIQSSIIPWSTDMTDIITLMLCNKSSDILSSVINRIQFVCFAISVNAPEDWIVNSLCHAFDFRPHSQFLHDCERINSLPVKLKSFCHDKKFSLKQLLNLSYHPRDLLIQLVDWSSSLHLTASIMDEIASNLMGYLQLHNVTVKEFLAEPDIADIVDSSLNPKDKTEHLRRLLNLKRFPILNEVNARIEDSVGNLVLPKGVAFHWDKTLENKNVNLSINISDPASWEAILKTLGSEQIKKTIKEILDEL